MSGLLYTRPRGEDAMGFRRNPTSLGSLARGQGSQNTGTNPVGAAPFDPNSVGGFVGGAAPGMNPITRTPLSGPRTHTQAPPTTITDGRAPGLYMGETVGDVGGGRRAGGFGPRVDRPSPVNPQLGQMTGLIDQLWGTNQNAIAGIIDAAGGNRADIAQHIAGRYFGGDMGQYNSWLNPMMYNAGGQYQYNANTGRLTGGWGQDVINAGTGEPTMRPGQMRRAANGGMTGGPAAGGAPSTGQPGMTQPGMGSPGYGVNVSDYLDPSMRFQMDEGLRALEGSAAARGSLASGDTLRDILRYSQGLASTDYGNAFGRAANVRDFTYGVDRDDRNFDYGVARDDRNFDYGRLRDLAGMGLSATGSAASGDNVLSGLIASLINNQGQIQGAGSIGQSNATNSSISQIISQLMMQQLLGQFGRAGA